MIAIVLAAALLYWLIKKIFFGRLLANRISVFIPLALAFMLFEPEIGALYYGKVVRIIPIGAFVELAPGKDGMIHISKLENRRVAKVEDVLKEGDMTWVKVTDIDDRGRVNLSRKDALKERAEMGLDS